MLDDAQTCCNPATRPSPTWASKSSSCMQTRQDDSCPLGRDVMTLPAVPHADKIFPWIWSKRDAIGGGAAFGQSLGPWGIPFPGGDTAK